MKRKLITIFFCFCSVITPALAQEPTDPATKEDVQQLFELMQTRKMFDSVMDSMAKQLPEMTSTMMKQQMPNATPQQMELMEAFTKEITAKMLSKMPTEQLMGAMMPAYQHNFTHSDMQYLIQFYSSPTGKKMVDKMPAIMSEYMQKSTPIMQSWMETEFAEVQKETEAYVKKMIELENQKSAPTTTPTAKPKQRSQKAS